MRSIAKQAVSWFAVAMALVLAPLDATARATTKPGASRLADTRSAAGLAEGTPSPLVSDVLDAQGASPAESAACQKELHDLAAQLRQSGVDLCTPRDQARTLHELIRRQVLTGKYQPSGSDVRAALTGGPFNCASATAVFLAIAAELNLEAYAVSVPGHVWCRVATPQGPLDVEMTCKRWFALMDRAPSHGGEAGQQMAKHPAHSGLARVLDQRAFIAIFHYNRGVQLLGEQQFFASALANMAALHLDPQCRVAYQNLLTTINNWSLALIQRGQRGLGLTLLGMGLVWAPGYEPFYVSYRHLLRGKKDS